MKCRIVERTLVNGEKVYVIQQKHFLFRWQWVDSCTDTFYTLKEAKENLCYFDGTTTIDKVIYP